MMVPARAALVAAMVLAAACSGGDDAGAPRTDPPARSTDAPVPPTDDTTAGTDATPPTTVPAVERTSPNPSDPPGATLNWEMPPRYEESWEAWQPRATYRAGGASGATERFGYDPAFVTPPAWTVRLDACASPAGGAPIRSFRWDVFRDAAPITVTESDDCRTTIELPGLGAYEVTLTVADTAGRSAIVTETIDVRDLLVVSFGDSIGAGEGNPDDGQWVSGRCHRSRTSGHARAAAALEDADPHTSVTYLNVACSGARIDRGVLGPYVGINPSAPDGPGPSANDANPLPLEPQLDIVRRALCADEVDGPCPAPRSIDVAVLSVGVNAAGFASVVANCADPTVATCTQGETADRIAQGFEVLAGPAGPTSCRSAQRRIDSGDPAAAALAEAEADCDGVSGSYATLATALAGFGIAPERTYIVHYPAHLFGPPDDPTSGGCDALGGIDADEATFMARSGETLQNLIDTSAAAAGWRVVTGVTEAFAGHAYCDDESWFVKAFESLANQGGFEGAAHPNASGHAALGELVAATLDVR